MSTFGGLFSALNHRQIFGSEEVLAHLFILAPAVWESVQILRRRFRGREAEAGVYVATRVRHVAGDESQTFAPGPASVG